MEYNSVSIKETNKIATEFAASLGGGDIVLLYGELGSGKTSFAKAVAKALKISDIVSSPTFTLMNIYQTNNHKSIKQLAHIDTYRHENDNDLLEIGIQDYLGEKDVLTLIEWPQKIQNILSNYKTISVYFDHVSTDNRRIRIENNT